MLTIHKQHLTIGDYYKIQLPHGSAVYSVGLDGKGWLSVWYQCNTEKKTTEDWDVWIRGTGHPLPEVPFFHQYFRGSVTMGPFVWHVFIKGPVS